jgi:hypothetical protein
MRILVSVLVSLFLTVPVMAQDLFEANYRRLATGSIEIGRIGFSDALRDKAALLGEDELARLASYLREDLQAALVASSWHGVAARETVLEVTILDVMPNRPTLSQIQQMAGVHYSAHTAGGADLSAVLADADGAVIATYDFSWYNPEPGDGTGSGIWSDTRTAFNRFARRLADSLGEAPMPGQVSGS